MNDNPSEKLNMDPSTIIISTAQVKLSTWSEEPIGGVAMCYSVIDNFSVTCIVELTAGINPCSGCQYPLTNFFDNTASFEKDYLYADLIRYNLTLSATNHFSQTFPDNNLNGDERAAACTAFAIKESGHIFCVIIHPNEIALKNFCEKQEWSYKKLQNC